MKSSFYRYVFNTSINIDFHLPKTDRCEKCESLILKKVKIETQSHDLHTEEKLAMRKEKRKDKLNGNENCLLVVFNLENVINLPKAEIGSFFYKRKLTLHNFTAMTSTKQGYCAIWTEFRKSKVRKENC